MVAELQTKDTHPQLLQHSPFWEADSWSSIPKCTCLLLSIYEGLLHFSHEIVT